MTIITGISVKQRVAELNQASTPRPLNGAIYRNRSIVVAIRPENKTPMLAPVEVTSLHRELQEVKKRGTVSQRIARFVSANVESPVRGSRSGAHESGKPVDRFKQSSIAESYLSALAKKKLPAPPVRDSLSGTNESKPVGDVKQPPVAAPRLPALAKKALPEAPVPVPLKSTVFPAKEMQTEVLQTMHEAAAGSAEIAEDDAKLKTAEPVPRSRKHKGKSHKHSAVEVKKSSSTRARRQEAPARKIMTEDWDPIEAGKTAAAPTMTKDPKIIASASAFLRLSKDQFVQLGVPVRKRQATEKSPGIGTRVSLWEKGIDQNDKGLLAAALLETKQR